MEWYEALILGIVQGLTEFLPVSSSGHLVLMSHFLGTKSSIGFDVAVHVGTLFSVLVFYRKKLLMMLKKPFEIVWKLVIASIPAAIVMLLFKKQIESLFTVKFLPVGFLLSSIFLYFIDKTKGEKELDNKASCVSGLFQALAVLPGVSRSGSTIFGSRLVGVKKEAAVDFSFIMSIPIIAGSGLIMLLDDSFDVLPMTFSIGAITAFVFGLISIKLTTAAVKTAKMKGFSVYLFLLSISLTIYNLFLANQLP